jgi:hypothetical protein
VTTKPTTPKGLDKAGSALWRDVTGKYELRADEQRILEDACRERDLLARLEAGLAGTDLIVKGSQGQDVINPIVSELRQHRSTFASLMRQLKLPDEGGSAGDSGGELSARNRAAAQARWSTRGA